MSLIIEIIRIKGTPKYYDWGSSSLIPALLNFAKTKTPIAEVWYGAHIKGPSTVDSVHAENLRQLINESPEELLGKNIYKKYGSRLPFLFKFLGIDKPLSVQVHPTLQQAQAGWISENDIGIPLDAPERVYVDSYDKPEQICAISDVWALCGFRSKQEIEKLLEPVKLLNSIRGESPGDMFLCLFELTDNLKSETLSLASSISGNHAESEVWQWVKKLLDFYPDDITALAPLFMNIIRLKPNESLYLNAGTIHAYLSGLAAEVMGSSDNVVRAGLTTKHIALNELQKIMNKESTQPEILTPVVSDEGWKIWPARNSYFQIGFGELDKSKLTISGPAILSVVDGLIEVKSKNQITTLFKGDSVFVCGDSSVEVNGSGMVYFCKSGAYEE